MKLTSDLFYQLSYTYFIFFKEQTSLAQKEAEALLKVLGIFINKTDPSEISFISNNSEIKIPSASEINFSKINNKITPVDLSRLDIEYLENILNNSIYIFTSCLMSPLFDCIGWVISNSSGKWKVNFIGGPTYDPWKTLLFERNNWADDLTEIPPEEKEWYKGNNWDDGFSEDELKNPSWKE